MSWTKEDYDYLVKRGLASDRAREEAQMRGTPEMMHVEHSGDVHDFPVKLSYITVDEPGTGNEDIHVNDDVKPPNPMDD